MEPFNTVIIPDPQNKDWAYYATKDGDKVTVNHRAREPKPGYLGGAGTLRKVGINLV